MLDQLVESRSTAQENKRRSGFLLTVFVLMVAALLGGWTYSLFGKEYGVSDDLDLSRLVAPVPIAEEEPPKPEPEEKPEKQQPVSKDQPQVATRTDFIDRVENSTKIPDKVNTKASNIPPIPKTGAFTKGTSNADPPPGSSSSGRTTGDGGGGGGFIDKKPPTKVEDKPDKPKPPPPPPPPPAPSKPISKGVVNGSAISLPKPPYPAAARAVRASGAVNVQVLIDENGNVVSATAVSGHPLLRQAAVQAARSAKFKPTLLSGQPVKVNGVIVYNFVP
jgi:protein TonB